MPFEGPFELDPLLVSDAVAGVEVFFKTLGTNEICDRPLPRGPRSWPEPPPRLFDTDGGLSLIHI